MSVVVIGRGHSSKMDVPCPWSVCFVVSDVWAKATVCLQLCWASGVWTKASVERKENGDVVPYGGLDYCDEEDGYDDGGGGGGAVAG